MRAKPFIKWAGGKGQLLEQLEKKLPIGFDNLENVTYIEPFIGGGAMLFYLLHKYHNIKKAVICDINDKLITCYSLIKNNPDALIASLKEIETKYYGLPTILDKKDFFLQARDKYNSTELSDIETSALLVFLNRTCFNGLYRENKSGKFNVPFGRYEHPLICDESNLREASKILQKVDMVAGDYSVCKKYASGNTLFYFDPPYKPRSKTSSFNSYNKDVFGDLEQIRLKTFCDEIASSGYHFLLSNSDCNNGDFFDKLYKDYTVEKVYAKRNINANPDGRGLISEITVCNYANENQLHYVAEPATNYYVK